LLVVQEVKVRVVRMEQVEQLVKEDRELLVFQMVVEH
tara:strand:+ start:32 stop:142 length:111 start_codon:yes stop_codon:yes gene_type:complete